MAVAGVGGFCSGGYDGQRVGVPMIGPRMTGLPAIVLEAIALMWMIVCVVLSTVLIGTMVIAFMDKLP